MTAATDHARNADVLDDAASLIERVGWRQGLPGDGVCLVSAIARSAPTQSLKHDAWGVMCRSLSAPVLYLWNDAETTTEQEVLDALRLAATSERTRADAIDANDPSP